MCVQVIPISSVDIWRIDDIDELKMDIEYLVYPPCFGVLAIPLSQNDPGFVILHFKPSEGKDFCIQLSLSLTALIYMTNGESRNKD